MRKKEKRFICVCLVVTLFSLLVMPLNVRAVKVKFGFSSVDAHVDLDTGDLTLYKWNREAYFKISTGQNKKNIQVSNGVVTVDYGKLLTVKIYEVNVDEGGVEYEAILKEKPPVNALSFPIDTKNLDWFYQPPLDQKLNVSAYDFVNATHAIKDGIVMVHRPENTVGSYAVYHAYKRNNEYKTGKAFHLYRPKAIDANGKETWLDLKVEKGKLTITISQEFLDAAAYPIIIDPTFGYTTEGSYYVSVPYSDSAIATEFTSPSDSGMQGVSISMYGNRSDFAPTNITSCLWYNGTGALVAETEKYLLPPTTPSWITLDFPTSPSIDSSTVYLIGFIDVIGGDYGYMIAADTMAGKNTYIDEENSYDNPENFVYSAEVHTDEVLSIYVTYTAGGAEYSRNASQALTCSLSSSRLIEITKNAAQSLSLTFSGSRLAEFIRVASQTISFGSTVSSIREFFRAAAQALSFSASVSNKYEFVRSLTQSLTFSTNASRLNELTRQFSQSLSFTVSSSRLIEVTKSVTQAITTSFKAVGDVISAYTRSASLTLLVRGWGQTPTLLFDLITPLVITAIIAFPVIVAIMMSRKRR